MSKLTNISFTEKGANAEQRFKNLVDKYLDERDNLETTLEDGTRISIRKQNLGERGIARFITIYDESIGYEFVLYPTVNIFHDEKYSGLKYAIRSVNLPEHIGNLDSGDLNTLEDFLINNLGA